MKWSDLDENYCPVARSLSVIGDRWTLLIVRDCFLGLKRFEEFQSSLGITRHLLSSRLKQLVDAGVLEKKKYSTHASRYEYVLTEKGEDLRPALMDLAKWGKTHMPVRRSISLKNEPREV